MNTIVPVAIAIIQKQNTYLLTERKAKDPDDAEFGRVWHFPGGAVEFGEQIEEALKREIQEELSVSITVKKQLPRIYSAIRSKWHGILIPHLCSIMGTENIVLDDESFRYGWFSFEEVKKLYTLPFVLDMLEDAIDLLKKS